MPVKLRLIFALIKENGDWKVWRDGPASENLSAFLDRGGEWKVSHDPAVLDHFAAALVSARTQDERNALLADNKQFLTVEMRQVLVRQAARHQAAGNYSALLNDYGVVQMVAEKIGDKEGSAIAEAGLGDAMRNLGRNAQALERFQNALALYESLGYKLQMAATLDEMGLIYLTQNEYSKAMESYRKVLAFAESFKDKSAIANAMEEIASVYYEQGSYTEALEFFDKALKLREAIRSKPEIAATLNNIGNAHYQQENYAAAIDYYQKAIAGFGATGDKQAVAGAMNNIGSAHYSQGNYDTALEFYEKSLKAEEELRDTQGQATSLLGIGLVYYAQGNNGPALERFQKNLALVESMRDKNRAASALHNIGLVYYHEQNYPLALESYRKSLLTTNDTALLEYVVTEGRVYLFVLARERGAEVGTPLADRSAGVSERATVSASRSVASTSLTPAPGPRTALMAYVLNLSGKDLAERAAKFRDLIARRDESFERGGRELFDLLLKPASEQLDDRQSWTIVPDSLLWQIPFQALQPADTRYLVESHAISYAPSLTALLEMRKPRGARAAPAKLLAFANPLTSKQRAERIKLANAEEKLDPSPETENEVRALRQLYATAESEIYLGAQAREENAKQRAGDFKALHFAAPATLNDVSPMYSHIVLADSSENGREDGLLEAWEIMRLSLRAELAILSASETSGRRVESGNGLMGLTWALFIAGCPATVVSEWETDSPSNTELMLELHRHLRFAMGASERARAERVPPRATANQQPQMSKAEALRQATLKLMQNSQYRHPFYWARFAIIGDER